MDHALNTMSYFPNHLVVTVGNSVSLTAKSAFSQFRPGYWKVQEVECRPGPVWRVCQCLLFVAARGRQTGTLVYLQGAWGSLPSIQVPFPSVVCVDMRHRFLSQGTVLTTHRPVSSHHPTEFTCQVAGKRLCSAGHSAGTLSHTDLCSSSAVSNETHIFKNFCSTLGRQETTDLQDFNPWLTPALELWGEGQIFSFFLTFPEQINKWKQVTEPKKNSKQPQLH